MSPYGYRFGVCLLICLMQKRASDIGQRVGQVIEVDNTTFSSEKARFLWVRVEVLLDQPL